MTRRFSTVGGGLGKPHQVTQARLTRQGWHMGSPGRSAPGAVSGRPEGGHPTRRLLPAARGTEDMSVLRQQIVERLAQVRRLGHSRQIRQFSKLGNRLRRVITGHLCLVAFRLCDQDHALLFATAYV